ncbi:hypothetical protein JQ615_01205 [Bradyrhizobium jicamae]|uniref:Uncharacterized protein n=1 Tax=Bradyrhizobium jicamae TaxID=280332 RepID=A0ABS5FB33_9BRAD|nr:hypothetical protein [Bradyrhizobium jicamae]MBR0793999.1 hypothetical protein [Bradyrhizobium jicamae]
MNALGHGSWLAIEQAIASRSQSEPLTVEVVQSVIVEAGGDAPSNKAIRDQIRTDAPTKGRTRNSYEQFWSSYKSSVPISEPVRLCDIDDCELHAKLRARIRKWSQLPSEKKDRTKGALTYELHAFLRAQSLKSAMSCNLSSETLLDRQFHYRSNFRVADLIVDADLAGLAPLNGLPTDRVRPLAHRHYKLCFDAASDGLCESERRAAKMVAGPEREGLLVMRSLFAMGAASAAEQGAALALLDKDFPIAMEWSGKLTQLLMRKSGKNLTVDQALKTLNAAFRKRRRLRLALDRLSYILASEVRFFLEEATQPNDRDRLRNEIVYALKHLYEEFVAADTAQRNHYRLELNRTLSLPTFKLLVDRNVITQIEAENVLHLS